MNLVTPQVAVSPTFPYLLVLSRLRSRGRAPFGVGADVCRVLVLEQLAPQVLLWTRLTRLMSPLLATPCNPMVCLRIPPLLLATW